MKIIDSQLHLWRNARMTAHHRQVPSYTDDDVLAIVGNRIRAGGINHQRTVKAFLFLRAGVAVVPIGAGLPDRQFIGECLARLDARNVDDRNHAANHGRELDQAVVVEVLGRERLVGGAEGDRLGLDLLLTAAGTYRLSDALELVSGVSNQNNRGGVMDNFAIRGFLGTPDGGGEYYVDGFLANRGMGPPRDPATTERIELLKGPAGALFGDIDPAGRVNIVSKTPYFVPAAYAAFTLGSFGTRRVELDATGPVSRTLAARIVVAAETSDGWRNFVGLDRQVVMPSLTPYLIATVRVWPAARDW